MMQLGKNVAYDATKMKSNLTTPQEEVTRKYSPENITLLLVWLSKIYLIHWFSNFLSCLTSWKQNSTKAVIISLFFESSQGSIFNRRLGGGRSHPVPAWVAIHLRPLPTYAAPAWRVFAIPAPLLFFLFRKDFTVKNIILLLSYLLKQHHMLMVIE